ncbi:MAG: MlaD family protein [Planctomycetota bacterium]|nr:MlaD family protein [Planctomycetota bacterium]
MSERLRNLTVGITVIVALAMLGGMILIFAGLPGAFRGGYKIKICFPATSDAKEGDAVHLAGMRIGNITDICFTDGDPRKGVTFTTRIDSGTRIPGNVRAYIYTRGFVGGAYMELKGDGPERFDAHGRVLEFLPAGFVITDGVLKGSGMVPDELITSLKGLNKLAENLNTLIAPAPAQTPTTTPATTPGRPSPAGLKNTVEKLNRTLDAMYKLVGDEENQVNFKVALANLAKATATANESMEAFKQFAVEAKAMTKTADRRIDELARKLIEDAEKISTLVTTLNQTAKKIAAGKGTAGRLINDPELYNNLVEVSKQMTKLLKEFRRLIEAWEESGVELKLK